MSSICFYFHVHQPYRLRHYRIFDIGEKQDYFEDHSTGSSINNEFIINKVSEKCYLPMNKVLLDLLNKHPEFKISYSFTGTLLDQLETFRPDVLDSFKRLIDTGRVEVVSETYYHSLAFLYSKEEFKKQVELHKKRIKQLFGVTPKVFRNTELIYNNELAQAIAEMGYKAILTEGADHILGWRSPNYLYSPKLYAPEKAKSKPVLLLKNYKLSDDIAFRFGSREWADYPLTADKYANWLGAINGSGEIVNLFMDYETFGEHQWEDTGIFDFMRQLPQEVLKHPDNDFVTVSEAADRYKPVAELDVHNYISWADIERDISAWRSNSMQHDALDKVYAIEDKVIKKKDKQLLEDWRKLQTSDHFYYMCTKWFNDGDVHKYFSPYKSPYEAFIAFMNVLQDLQLRLDAKKPRAAKKTIKKTVAAKKPAKSARQRANLHSR